jgi:hypothetical protein
VVTRCVFEFRADTTTASYNASAVKIYNATSSPRHFEKNFFLLIENAPGYYSTGVVVVKSSVVGLAPGFKMSSPVDLSTYIKVKPEILNSFCLLFLISCRHGDPSPHNYNKILSDFF